MPRQRPKLFHLKKFMTNENTTKVQRKHHSLSWTRKTNLTIKINGKQPRRRRCHHSTYISSLLFTFYHTGGGISIATQPNQNLITGNHVTLQPYILRDFYISRD